MNRTDPTRSPVLPPATLGNHTRRRAEASLWRRAFAASLILHLAIFLLWQAPPPDPYFLEAVEGYRTEETRSAGGGTRVVQLRIGEPPPIPRPPVPAPEEVARVEEVETDPEPPAPVAEVVPQEAPSGAEAAGDPGPDAADAEGSGAEDGAGAGDAGAAEEGNAGMSPPVPRGMIIPPSSRSLRGRTVEVWVFVDRQGRVVPDSTVLRPPTGDRSFNRRLVEESARWVFRPALQGGEPVGAWFPYRISM